jgi:uncharacterized membrane protein
MVQRKRHIAKAISWRILGTIDTMIIAGLISGSWKIGVSVGGVEVITKIALYYFHERLWYNYVSFGLDKDLQD